MAEIKSKDIVYARHISSADAWMNGLNFFSADSEFIQVGSWNYDKDKKLLAHQHNELPRTVAYTQEVLFVKSGSIMASIYNLENELICDIKVNEGDILILLAGGHGYEILDDNTQVLEIKNGPYYGADADRTRLPL